MGDLFLIYLVLCLLQALGYVLIARPEYMLEKDVRNILEATLSSGADVRLKVQVHLLCVCNNVTRLH